MDFTISKTEFLRGLALAHGIADKKSALPILANVLLRAESNGTLLLAASDQVVTLTAELTTTSVKAPGGLTLGARNLFDIARSAAGDEIRVRAQENQWAEITAGKSRFKLVGLAAKDFPKLPDHREVAFTKLPIEALSELIEKTIFSVSNDETRYHLSGVCLESADDTLRAVSTDGHRLSKAERTGLGFPAMPAGVLVPRKGLADMARLLDAGVTDCEFAVHKPHAFLRVGSIVVSAKLVEAQFPPYQQVMPKESANRAVVDRAALVDALQRVSILASEKTSGVRLNFKADSVEVASDNPDLGEACEEVACDFSGAPVAVSFNAKYLGEALTHMGDAEVAMSLGGALDPCVVRGTDKRTDGGFVAVIMPMRT